MDVKKVRMLIENLEFLLHSLKEEIGLEDYEYTEISQYIEKYDVDDADEFYEEDED